MGGLCGHGWGAVVNRQCRACGFVLADHARQSIAGDALRRRWDFVIRRVQGVAAMGGQGLVFDHGSILEHLYC